jgi:hypothetical protein
MDWKTMGKANWKKWGRSFLSSLLLGGIGLIGSGCGYKTTSENIYLTIRTPNYRISDQGFLNTTPTQKELIIYKEFTPYRIVIGKREVCEGEKCLSKRAFLKKVGLADYPPNILDQILEGKPLSFLPSPTSIDGGFIQQNQRFFYKVGREVTLFKDREKKVVISLKRLGEK